MKEKIFCKECNTQTDLVIDSFSRYHLKKNHNMTMKEYYDKHLKKKGEGICECGKETTIRRFSKGYNKFCSPTCINKNKEVRKKMYMSNLNKTDIEKENIKNKRIQTNLNNFGVIHYSMLDNVKNMKRQKMFKKEIDKYSSVCEKYNMFIKKIVKNEVLFHCDVCDNDFKVQKQMINKRNKKNQIICTHCNPLDKYYSYDEKDIYDFIKKIYMGTIIQNDRKILNGYELDIYLPDLKLAFEFNGLYWHSELHKHSEYHLEKTKECFKKSVRLIHIYEDDWIYKKEIVKSRILNLLGKSERVYARKCTIKNINNHISKQFLYENHIQGSVNSKYNIGLYYNKELVSLMTFNNSRFEKDKIEMLRFCNKLNVSVVGGASKLFKYFIKNNDVHQEIISYADRSWSKGGLYEKLGFCLVKETKPNYHYIVNRIRENRFKYRKSELIKDGFDDDKTEREIMFERGIYRIYNSGNLKYLYLI